MIDNAEVTFISQAGLLSQESSAIKIGEHPAPHSQVDPLETQRIEKACRIADDQRPISVAPRDGVPAALRQRLRAVAHHLALGDDPLEEGVLLPLDEERVRVEGEVLEVCLKKGCWMNLAGDQPGSKVRIKVPDDAIVFPPSAEGKYAVAEGLVKKTSLSLEETRAHLAHEAEEQGREFDPASVTSAITIVRVDGLGAMIRNTK